MKLVLLTPGTGSYYCGVCMRDNALARRWIQMGHDAVMLPMYLPLTLDEAPAQMGGEVFFGGIAVYLQQKLAWFRNAPPWVDRILNHPVLLRWAGKLGGMTGGSLVGELTFSMLQGRNGYQVRELDKLIDWMRADGKPDAVWLSTALLAGLAAPIREALGVPVLCSLQGEDDFLDHLAAPWRERCWEQLARCAADIPCLIAPSRYFAEVMQTRLGLQAHQVRVVPNGIALEDYEAAPRMAVDCPTVGYLARFVEGKGLGILVEAFIRLKERGRVPRARLRCAGAMTEGDAVYVESLRKRVEEAGCGESVEFLPNLGREEKVEFLRGLTVFSVPAVYSEAFGLYVLEAMAAGVPVVQPRHAAFPEVVEATGGGRLFEPRDVESLAQALEELLLDPGAAQAIGATGRAAVFERYSMERLAGEYLDVTREMIDLQGGRS
jgi:glycosyltransferase involved in cell wall biosynthesis